MSPPRSHNLPTTHPTPATKNGSGKKMTARRDVPWRVSTTPAIWSRRISAARPTPIG